MGSVLTATDASSSKPKRQADEEDPMKASTDVRVTSASKLDWLVWLDATVVGRFARAADALALAALLECSPRERARVASQAGAGS
jgi:hypothetical protein